MPHFTRRTILGALDTFERLPHSEIDRFLLEHGIEDVAPPGFMSKQKRATTVAKYLLENPEESNLEGRNLVDVIVNELVTRAIDRSTIYTGFNYKDFQKANQALHRGLEKDGFTVEDGRLRRTLPEALDLPKADDEVHTLLNTFNFTTALGHLDQALAAHTRGEWAAANAQLRSFVEELFDKIAEQLHGSTVNLPHTGRGRRRWLARTDPPFFISGLKEWTGQGTGFLEAFYQRLHPRGSHPGLSDEDDSTFRLHLVLLTARLLLKRLQRRAPA